MHEHRNGVPATYCIPCPLEVRLEGGRVPALNQRHALPVQRLNGLMDGATVRDIVRRIIKPPPPVAEIAGGNEEGTRVQKIGGQQSPISGLTEKENNGTGKDWNPSLEVALYAEALSAPHGTLERVTI
jgi:hypothetical protein